MFYTLADAIEDLKGSRDVYTSADLTVLINKAIRALSRMKGWQCLRKVLRFISDGPRFALPQGCSGLVRACVNGNPATVRGQDFRFVHSGPGDTDVMTVRRPPPGFTPIRNVNSLGLSPVVVEPPSPFRLFAVADDAPAGSSAPPPALSVRGMSPDGRVVRVVLAALPSASSADVSAEVPNSVVMESVIEVSVGHDESGSFVPGATSDRYATLYAEDVATSVRYPLAALHPRVPAPYFHRYSISMPGPPRPIELLTEVRIDPLPLVNDTDVLPFESLEPVEWMIRSDWEMRSGEVSKAEKYRNDAAAWLQAQEITAETAQRSVIVNSVYAGSPGELTMEMENI